MREEILHYVWKFKKFEFQNLQTSNEEKVLVFQTGLHNKDEAGPDFFNAKIQIGTQLWAGNVEIHLKSSDWYAHRHEMDSAYDNVILHIVWEHDVEVYRKDNSLIPTLILKDFTSSEIFTKYQALCVDNKQWINCEKDFHSFSDFQIEMWQERLFVERLQQKEEKIQELLETSHNNWEAVLFQLLSKNFGLNMNGEHFLQIAKSIPFSVIQKNEDAFQLEALFFGQGGMLQSEIDEHYFLQLKKEYNYLKHKFQLEQSIDIKMNYFKLRPVNFPTIRLSQLAMLYASTKQFFKKIIEIKNVEQAYQIFEVETTLFWKTHYTFQKESKARSKKISKDFIHLILINTVIPLMFSYGKYRGIRNNESLLELMQRIPTEKNSIIKKFNKLKEKTVNNALASQAMLQLKKQYCSQNKCLQCSLGLQLLKST